MVPPCCSRRRELMSHVRTRLALSTRAARLSHKTFSTLDSWRPTLILSCSLSPRRRQTGGVMEEARVEKGRVVVPTHTPARPPLPPPPGLPGLDVALVLGAEVYHTHADSSDRLAPATLQALGNDVVGIASAAASSLADRAATAPPASPSPTLGGGGRAVYFDVLGRIMFVYSASVGRVAHSMPLVVAVVAVARLPSPRRAAALSSAAATAASMTFAALAPGALGALLAASTARAIPWFGPRGGAAVAAFAPAALAGWLLPHTAPAPAHAALTDPVASVLGCALAAGGVAAAFAGGGFGTAYLPAFWSLTSLTLALLPVSLSPRPRAVATLAIATPAMLLAAPNAFALSMHIFQKASFAGAPLPPPTGIVLGDAVAGAVAGAGVVSALGVLGPSVVAAVGGARSARRAAHAAATLATAAWLLSAAVSRHPYTPAAPKKLFVQLVHRAGGESVWAAAGVDARPVVDALPSKKQWARVRGDPATRRDWLSLYPMGTLLDTAGVAAVVGGPLPLPAGGGGKEGSPLRVTAKRSLSPAHPATDRVSLSIQLLPGQGSFAAANVTARVAAWGRQGAGATGEWRDAPASPAWRVVRLVGSPPHDTHALWFDVAAGSRLSVEVAASVVGVGGDAKSRSVLSALPAWASAAVLQTWTGEWVF